MSIYGPADPEAAGLRVVVACCERCDDPDCPDPDGPDCPEALEPDYDAEPDYDPPAGWEP